MKPLAYIFCICTLLLSACTGKCRYNIDDGGPFSDGPDFRSVPFDSASWNVKAVGGDQLVAREKMLCDFMSRYAGKLSYTETIRLLGTPPDSIELGNYHLIGRFSLQDIFLVYDCGRTEDGGAIVIFKFEEDILTDDLARGEHI